MTIESLGVGGEVSKAHIKMQNSENTCITKQRSDNRKQINKQAKKKHSYLCKTLILHGNLWYRHAVNCHGQAQYNAQTARPHASSSDEICVSVLESAVI